jgi:hypothetical protein
MNRKTLLGWSARFAATAAVAVSFAACSSAAAGPSVATRAPFSDPNAVGYIGLCSSSGGQITSGSISSSPFAWRAVSSAAAHGPYDNSYRTATLLAYQPQQGLTPGEWSGSELTASSRYSNPAHPMAEATPGDGSLQDFMADFPPRWDGFLQLRIYLSTADAQPYSLRYPALDIQVIGNTWYAVGGGTVNCNAGTAESIESILLPKSSITTSSSNASTTAWRDSSALSDGRSDDMNTLSRIFAASAAVLTGSLGAAVTAHGVAGAAAHAERSPALAATAPPWEPNPNSVGSLAFYNSSGAAITGGSLTSQPVAAYVQGTSIVRAGDTKATLFAYTPDQGEATGQWNGLALSASTPYPNAAAPKSIPDNSGSSALPLVTGQSGDLSITQYAQVYPNTSSTNGYANMYELRVYTSKPGEQGSTTYDSADILVDTTAGTWSVYYAPRSTTTTITASPTTIVKGQKVTLTAKETPTAAGSVQFYEGTAKLGTPVAETTGTATLPTTALAAGVQSLSAIFTPSNTNLWKASKTSVVKVTVKTPTATKLSASPATITKGQKVTFTATESPATAGTVQFYNGKSKLGTPAKVVKGVSTYETTALPVGTLTIDAVFSPTTPTLYVGSTGTLKYTVKA